MPRASDRARRRAAEVAAAPPRRGAGGRVAPALLVAAVAALGACAQRPETIASVRVDEARYGHLTCPELGHEMASLQRELANLSTEQSAKRVNDIVGWTHLLAPVQSVKTRDIRSWIALQKGELEAVDRAMARRCVRAPLRS